MKVWVLFLALSIVAWGAYGPTIHAGQLGLGKSPLRAFLCVGAAYFLVAVCVPVGLMLAQGESFNFQPRGALIALLAGAFGAIGALGVVLAFKFGGKPVYVMPLVFAGAPIVNVIVSVLLHPPKQPAEIPFYVGLVLTAAGAGMVLYYRPA